MIPTSFLALSFVLQAGGAEPAPTPKPIVVKAARLFDGKSDALIPDGDGDRRGQGHQGRRRGSERP